MDPAELFLLQRAWAVLRNVLHAKKKRDSIATKTLRSWLRFVAEQTVGALQLFDDYPLGKKGRRRMPDNGTDKKRIDQQQPSVDRGVGTNEIIL